MTTYAPNAFSTGAAGAPAARAYAPNPFSGQAAPGPGPMAPHLSVPASQRPFAEDIGLLRGSEYIPQNMVPTDETLDKMWRFSPMTYQAQLSQQLRQPGVADALSLARNPLPVQGASRPGTDDNGNPVEQYYDAESGSWRARRSPGEG